MGNVGVIICDICCLAAHSYVSPSPDNLHRTSIYAAIFTLPIVASIQVLTGIFAQASVANFDGITKIPGGWLDRNWGKC